MRATGPAREGGDPIEPSAEVQDLTPRTYYRLPWSLTDNGISWLEVTDACNLDCRGCYRPHIEHHKSLDEIDTELEVFRRQRKSDCMSIAGGDPLVHPQIVEIVRRVRAGGWKPIVNTNGLALGPRLLRKLKRAGLAGFTFHIDTTQTRADSPAEREAEHNALRTRFAEMVAAEGGLGCSFNQTVSHDTLEQVRDTVAWALEMPDIVHTVVFILFRTPHLTGDFDFYANGSKVSLFQTYEERQWGGELLLHARDVVAQIREVDPDYEPSAYLNGTVDPDSAKWLLATRVASRRRGYGYVGPRFMEAVQQGHHWLRGTWLSYSSPRFLGMGRSTAALFSPLDPALRRVARSYAGEVLRRPSRWRERLHLQTFTVIQPVDILPDGRMDMCDGCPDMTVHDGRLYWSCRLEEVKRYGCFVRAVPKTGHEPAAFPAEPVSRA
jgi:hypothetical protein